METCSRLQIYIGNAWQKIWNGCPPFARGWLSSTHQPRLDGQPYQIVQALHTKNPSGFLSNLSNALNLAQFPSSSQNQTQ